MQKLNVNELREHQLGILAYIDNICKKNNLKYFVSYGTLLGAIRHKGYIPWDDDIDIQMPRIDYEKFKKLVLKDNNKRYNIMSNTNVDWYFQNFSVVVDTTTKILGSDNLKEKHDTHIFVDVFPIDKFNNIKIVNRILLLLKLKHISLCKKNAIIYKDSKIKDFARAITWYLIHPIKPRFFTNIIEKIVRRNYDKDGKYEGTICASKDGIKEVHPANFFDNIIESDFENIKVPIIANYDKFLTQLYGDYMTPPSEEEKAIASHNLKAYKID